MLCIVFYFKFSWLCINRKEIFICYKFFHVDICALSFWNVHSYEMFLHSYLIQLYKGIYMSFWNYYVNFQVKFICKLKKNEICGNFKNSVISLLIGLFPTSSLKFLLSFYIKKIFFLPLIQTWKYRNALIFKWIWKNLIWYLKWFTYFKLFLLR